MRGGRRTSREIDEDKEWTRGFFFIFNFIVFAEATGTNLQPQGTFVLAFLIVLAISPEFISALLAIQSLRQIRNSCGILKGAPYALAASVLSFLAPLPAIYVLSKLARDMSL